MQDGENIPEIKEQNDSEMDHIEGKEGRVYELGYLLVPTEASEGIPAIYGNLKELVLSFGGEIIADEMPRIIQLAYTMLKVYKNVRSKYDTAYFGWIKFTMDSQKLLELKKKLDLDPNIIRHLMIKTVKENTIAARRFVHRDMIRRRPPTKTDGSPEVPVEINKEKSIKRSKPW